MTKTAYLQAGIGVSCLLLLSIYGSLGGIFSSEPVDTPHPVIVDLPPEPVPIKEDYIGYAKDCYDYITSLDLQVFSRIDFDYADGAAWSKTSEFVYLTEPIYFDDGLLMRFVGSSGKVISVESRGGTTQEVTRKDSVILLPPGNNSLLSDTDIFRYDIATIFSGLAVYTEETMPLQEKQLLKDYFGDSPSYRNLNLQDAFHEAVQVTCVDLGKSDLNLDYHDRVLVQLSSDTSYVTILVKLNDQRKVIDFDFV